MGMVCAKALGPEGAQYKVGGLRPDGVKLERLRGAGPHPANNEGQCRGFNQDSDMVTSSVEKQHSDWSRIVDKKEK